MVISCQKTVIINVKNSPQKNVCNVILSKDSFIGGYFYESLQILSNDSFRPIFEGSMKIFDQNNTQVAYQLLSNSGGYFSNNKVQEGACYTLDFSSYFGTSYAKTCVPLLPNITNLDTAVIVQQNDTLLRIRLSIKDSSIVANYYTFSCKSYEIFRILSLPNGTKDTQYKWIDKALNSNNPLLFINENNYSNKIYLLEDKQFDGQLFDCEFTLSLTTSNLKEIIFYVDAIDINLFKYYRTFNAQRFYSNDPNAHYISVFNNIENGYGIFGARSRFSYYYKN